MMHAYFEYILPTRQFKLDNNQGDMFKSSRSKDPHQFNFDSQLDKKLSNLKEETSHKKTINNNINHHHLASIIDEVVLSLQEPYHPLPQSTISHKYGGNEYGLIKEMAQLEMDRQSSIQLVQAVEREENNHGEEKKVIHNHISNLVAHQQLVIFLRHSFSNYKESHEILLIDFIKKSMAFFVGLHLKDSQIYQTKKMLQNELTTTNLDYLSLNALEIVSKRQKIQAYLSKIYVKMKIETKMHDIQKKQRKNEKRMSEKEEFLSVKQSQLSSLQDKLHQLKKQLAKKQQTSSNRQKALTLKSKELLLRQRQLKKGIEDKCLKLFEQNTLKFHSKVKQSQRRLLDLQRSIKYKMSILQSRSDKLKEMNAEKIDINNKKVHHEHQYKIKCRRLEKDMEGLEKKYLAKMQESQHEYMSLNKVLAEREDKIGKLEVRNRKNKDKMIALEQQNSVLGSKVKQLQEDMAKMQLIKQQSNRQGKLTLKDHKSEDKSDRQVPNKKKNRQIAESNLKSSKTNRSSKKHKQNHLYPIIFIYQQLLEIKQKTRQISRPLHQSLLQTIMEQSIKQLPTIISLLTSEDPSNIHYLILNITDILLKEFYHLNKSNPNQDYFTSGNYVNKVNKPQILQLLKCPFDREESFSLLLYLLQIIDWHEESSSCFFKENMELVMEIMGGDKVSGLMESQLCLLRSGQCLLYMVHNAFLTLNHRLSLNKQQHKLQYNLVLCISLIDLILQLHKMQLLNMQPHPYRQIVKIIFNTLQISLPILLQSKATHETLQELAQKISILLQRMNGLGVDQIEWLSACYQDVLKASKQRCGFELMLLNVKSMMNKL